MNTLKSKRTCLRRLRSDDYENMRKLESDSLVMKNTPSRVPQTPQQTRDRLSSQIERQSLLEPFGIWVAQLQADDDFIGWFMLLPQADSTLELGFMLVQKYWHQGFAFEVSQMLVDFARAQGVPSLIAHTDTDNHASMQILKKLGFERVGRTVSSDAIVGGQAPLNVFKLELRPCSSQ